MGRYDIPEPKCDHKERAFRVTSGDFQASTYVCSREACIEDAKEWAYASTHIEPEVVELPKREGSMQGRLGPMLEANIA